MASSRYFGLIFSRLYTGSWLPDLITQSFTFTFKKLTLAEYLQEQDTDNVLNVFVGSSYAFHEIVRLNSHLKRSSRTKAPFKLFSEGFLKPEDWNLNPLPDLEVTSLAQEFPGWQEPNWEEKPN